MKNTEYKKGYNAAIRKVKRVLGDKRLKVTGILPSVHAMIDVIDDEIKYL